MKPYKDSSTGLRVYYADKVEKTIFKKDKEIKSLKDTVKFLQKLVIESETEILILQKIIDSIE